MIVLSIVTSAIFLLNDIHELKFGKSVEPPVCFGKLDAMAQMRAIRIQLKDKYNYRGLLSLSNSFHQGSGD